MQNIMNASSDTVLAIIIFFILFLILREFITWYWKLNKISDTLLRIEAILEEMESKISSPKNLPPK